MNSKCRNRKEKQTTIVSIFLMLVRKIIPMAFLNNFRQTINRREEKLRIVSKAFAGVLNYLLCRIAALKILQHMSERSEFVLQNLWF